MKIKFLIFYLINKKSEKINLYFFFFFFLKNKFSSFNQHKLSNSFFKKSIATGLIEEDFDSKFFENEVDSKFYEQKQLQNFDNKDVMFLNLKKKNYKNETFLEKDYLNLQNLKLNTSGDYFLGQEKGDLWVDNINNEYLEEEDEEKPLFLETDSKISINTSHKSYLYFFHKLPSLIYKKSKNKNKLFLLKKFNYSRIFKNKVFDYLADENNTHPVSFLKNLLSTYKVKFDNLEEEYIYSSFDNLKSLKNLTKESISSLFSENFFEEYKLDTVAIENSKKETTISSLAVNLEEKIVYTIVSRINETYEKSLDFINNNNKPLSINYIKKEENSKNISNSISLAVSETLSKEKINTDVSKNEKKTNKKNKNNKNLKNEQTTAPNLNKNEQTITPNLSKKEETKKSTKNNNNKNKLKENVTSVEILKKEDNFNDQTDKFSELFAYKLDLINESWTSLFDNYSFFLQKKEDLKINNVNFLNFFFFDNDFFFYFNEFNTKYDSNFVKNLVNKDISLVKLVHVDIEDTFLNNIDYKSLDLEFSYSNENVDAVKNYISFLDSNVSSEKNKNFLNSTNFKNNLIEQKKKFLKNKLAEEKNKIVEDISLLEDYMDWEDDLILNDNISLEDELMVKENTSLKNNLKLSKKLSKKFNSFCLIANPILSSEAFSFEEENSKLIFDFDDSSEFSKIILSSTADYDYESEDDVELEEVLFLDEINKKELEEKERKKRKEKEEEDMYYFNFYDSEVPVIKEQKKNDVDMTEEELKLLSEKDEKIQETLNFSSIKQTRHVEVYDKKRYSDFFFDFFNLKINSNLEDWILDSFIENYFLNFSSDFLDESILNEDFLSTKIITEDILDKDDILKNKIKDLVSVNEGYSFFYNTSSNVLDELIGFEDPEHKSTNVFFSENELNLVFDDNFLNLNDEEIQQNETNETEAVESESDLNNKKKIIKNYFYLKNETITKDFLNSNIFEENINDAFLNIDFFFKNLEVSNTLNINNANENIEDNILFETDFLNDIFSFNENTNFLNEVYLKRINNLITDFSFYVTKFNFFNNFFVESEDEVDNNLFYKNNDNFELEYFSFDTFESEQKLYIETIDTEFPNIDILNYDGTELLHEENNSKDVINSFICTDCSENDYEVFDYLTKADISFLVKNTDDTEDSNYDSEVMDNSNVLKDDSFFYVNNFEDAYEDVYTFNKNFLPFFFLIKKIKNVFFLKSILNFFFFFLPVSFFSFVYDSFYRNIKKLLDNNKLLLNGNLKNYETQVDLVDVLYNYDFETKTKNKNNNFCFFLFLSNFFSKKISENVSIAFASTTELEFDFKHFFYKNFKEMSFFFKNQMINFNYSDFFDIFFLCLKMKDLTSFADFLKELFEKIQIKFHKTFLKKFELFLFSFFIKLKKKFKIKGFMLDVRGKVSVVGNSKKRHILVKKGYLSKSKKTLKFFFCKNQINTTTGVLGATYILSF